MSCVPDDIWCDGYVIAYMMPVADGVRYKYMNALCERMHALEPRVKFDNREWLGRVHYIHYLGDYALARAAFVEATREDGHATWHIAEPETVSQVQMFSESWQEAQERKEKKAQ